MDDKKELVLKRLDKMSGNIVLYFGDKRYTKNDIIREVEQDTEFGKKFVELQIKYIKFTKDFIYKNHAIQCKKEINKLIAEGEHILKCL
jgi:hypothetical protein